MLAQNANTRVKMRAHAWEATVAKAFAKTAVESQRKVKTKYAWSA
jgi:hypothetical protein